MTSKVVSAVLLVCLFATRALATTQDDRHHHNHNNNNNNNHHNHSNNKCFECKNCRYSDSWCLSNCKKECRYEQGINIEKCKSYGNDAGWRAANAACDLTLKYCSQSSRTFGAPQRGAKVSLQQCGIAAYGVCQAKAMDPRQSPCGWAFRGKDACDGVTFMNFYTGEVDWQCNQATAVFDRN